MTKLGFQVCSISINSIADLKLGVGHFFVMESFGNLITKAALLDDLFDQSFIAVLEVGFRLRPADRALG